MGLDITGYSKLSFVAASVSEDEADRRNLVYAHNNGGLPSRLDGLPEGYYEQAPDGRSHGFRAGSYGSYNWWRAELSRFALGVNPEAIWDGYADSHAGKPFAELIHFSDCEGAIGPKTSAKLAADFERSRALAVAHAEQLGEPGERWLHLYDEWARTFRLAADGGLVEFH